MPRDPSLDVVKGWCVLVMAIHHAINCFPELGYSLRYVHFVSGAFPFLAGFVSMSVHGQSGADRRNAGSREIARGLRLVAMCVLLNVPVWWMDGQLRGGLPGVATYLADVFALADYRFVRFSLLIPIGYVLIVMGALRVAGAARPSVALALALGLFLCCMGMRPELPLRATLSFLAIGLLGAACGGGTWEFLRRVRAQPLALLLLYLGVQAVILRWRQPLPIYVVNVVVSVFLLLATASWAGSRVWFHGLWLLWGRYTLVLYLAQIALFAGIRGLTGPVDGLTPFIGALAAVCLFQAGLAWAIDAARKSSARWDRAYRMCFG